MNENEVPCMDQVSLSFSAVSDTAVILGFDVDCLADLSVNNPRVFGVLVDATVLRLTNSTRKV